MRRIIRWADAEGRVAVGIELDEDGHFYELVGTSDPMRLLQGESFDVQSKPVVPVDPYSLELGYGLTLLPPLDPPEVWCAGVFGMAAENSTSPVTSDWFTMTLQMRWSDGDWKVDSFSQKDGPAPVNGDNKVSTSEEVSKAVEEYGGFTYAR